jgi:hypothetical protein
MNNNIQIISIVALSFLLTSCGFKKISQINTNIIYIQNIKISGEERFSSTMKNNILLISNIASENKYDAEIKIKKHKTNKIKDKAGTTTRYNLSISAKLKLINIDSKETIQKTFVRNNDYMVGTTHSITISNEVNTTKIIMQQLSDSINQFITLSMRNT